MVNHFGDPLYRVTIATRPTPYIWAYDKLMQKNACICKRMRVFGTDVVILLLPNMYNV